MAYFRQPTHAEAEAAIRELVSTLQVIIMRYACRNLYNYICSKCSLICQAILIQIRVSEIVKAGSMGHGTIVPGSFDIDLVLYSHGKQTCMHACMYM